MELWYYQVRHGHLMYSLNKSNSVYAPDFMYIYYKHSIRNAFSEQHIEAIKSLENMPRVT